MVALAMVLAIILILCLPRKYAIAPLLFGVFTIPLGQVVVLAGIHFTVLRVLIIAGLIRRAISRKSPLGSKFGGRFNPIDVVTILWTIFAFLIFSLQWMETQALIAGLGDLLDRLGGYLAVRFLIQDMEDAKFATKVLAAVCFVSGLCMINEHITGRNIFGYLGGVFLYPQIRNGQLRAQAAFGVYIDAGVFGAIMIPLFIWLWNAGKSRASALMGLFGGISMMIASSSSTPLLGFAGGFFGLCLWPLRKSMKILRWGFVMMLVGLQMVMKAPVWALIARVDLTGSSSGYHRYMLVDNCIRHFSDWWLLGYRFYNNWGWDMWDLSNQFVAVALTGGLITLVLFVMMLSRSFGAIGMARKQVEGDRPREWFLWCLGAALFANVVSFFGCSYMAQMQMALFALLGIICVAFHEATQPVLAPSPVAETPAPRFAHGLWQSRSPIRQVR
ncbi:MAG: hypothetical protein KGL02_09030 [Acidobacteriota bacterium]|nr:hypothetical protein [Acidobacteriota bacterium]